jgi:endonuclease III
METVTVNPIEIPTEKFSRLQLEDWILFGILVANKEAAQTRRKLDSLLEVLRTLYPQATSPFDAIRQSLMAGTLRSSLVAVRTGQYNRIAHAFYDVINLDLDNLSVEALESVHGIGPKTARMTMLYAFPGLEVVPLDTHVLKFLRERGYENVPKATPPAGPQYKHWEAVFVEESVRAGLTVLELDTKVWRKYATSLNKAVPRG